MASWLAARVTKVIEAYCKCGDYQAAQRFLERLENEEGGTKRLQKEHIKKDRLVSAIHYAGLLKGHEVAIK